MPTSTRSQNRNTPRPRFTWAGGVVAIIAVAHLLGATNPRILADPMLRLISLVVAAMPAGWLLWRWFQRRQDDDLGLDLEMSAAVMVLAVIVGSVGFTFGLDLFPVMYLVLAVIVAFQSRVVGLASVALGIVMTAVPSLVQSYAPSIWFGAEEQASVAVVLTRFSFVCVFGALASIVHGAEVLDRRRRHQQEVAEEKENLMRQARELRLLSTRRDDVNVGRKEKVELITRDAVDAVNHAIFVGLSLLKTGLDAHTCILLWFDVRGEKLRIKELVSDSDSIVEGEIDPAKGVIGGITRRREPVRLEDLKPGFRGLVYYRDSDKVTSFLGVPIIEDGHLRGVLAVDRTDGRRFEDQEVALVEEVGAYIVRAVENERLFATIEKSKHELSRFFDASRRLNGVLTPEEAYIVALEAVAEIVPYDFAAITVSDGDQVEHEIVAIDGTDVFPNAEEWNGRVFDANSGLVSMVVKNRHYLPYGGVIRDQVPVVFEREQQLEGLQSMLVLPLIVQDQTIGTFVVGHKSANRYTVERREMLEVVSNQVAVTLQNARLYAQMEEMATIDGLTGLVNHRTFQTRLDETIARHRRSNQPFGLILTDIDHFKNVNDTYGHPVGDEVLRQVSACFRANLRETDVPARYGGEEFAIILEDTDLEGCRVIAERLRTEIKKLVYQTDKGPFSCTISMGIGHWPADALEKQDLIDLSDQALYFSKRNGRDRVTPYAEIAQRAS